MDCFPGQLRRKIDQLGHGSLAASIELNHTRLLKFRHPKLTLKHIQPVEGVTFAHCYVIWQAHLHRVERLMVSCGRVIESNDPYSLAALIRAHIESTAVVTSVRAQMLDFQKGRLPYEQFDAAIDAALVGGRSEHLKKSPTATNILTHIKKADRFIDEHLSMTVQSPLSLMYGVLSEYAHPNMPSNTVAFFIEEPGVYCFQHRAKISEKHIVWLGMLNTSSTIFESLSRLFQEELSTLPEMTSA